MIGVRPLAPFLLAALFLATGASPRPAALSEALVRALDAQDPLALADTTLPRVARLDSMQRAAVAARLAGWPVPRRVAAWAFLQVGTPYQLGPLGEEAPPDTQPLITFATSDCAVLNLVSAAMAHAPEAGGERAAMAVANYRRGVVSYASRFHFTTDRLDSCPYYRDVTRKVAGDQAKIRRVTLNRKSDGSRWIPIDWSRARDVAFVPRELGPLFARWYEGGRLPEVTGVAFVQEPMLA